MKTTLWKRIVSFALAMVMIMGYFPSIAIEADAATALNNLAVKGLKATYDTDTPLLGGSATCSDSSDSINANAAGYYSNKWLKGSSSVIITLTNNDYDNASLTFKYTNSNGTITVTGATKQSDGTYKADLTKGNSVKITLKTPENATTCTLAVTDIALVEKVVRTTTFEPAESTQGSYTVNGETIGSTSVKTQDATIGYNLVATPKSGYIFMGWNIVGGDEYIAGPNSAIYTYYAAENRTVTAVFAPAGTALFGVGNRVFTDLNAANTYASNASTKQINLLNNGTLYPGNYTISSGNTLLIPFDDAYTCYITSPKFTDNSWSKPYAFRRLTMAKDAVITVNGAISVSSVIASGNGGAEYTGAPTGAYGHISMNSGSAITVNNGGCLYAWGFITGDGVVTANSGASIYECMQVTDFRGGSATKDLQSGPVFPFSQYYVQNIETQLILHSGAKEYAATAINTGLGTYDSTVPFIGASDAMFGIGTGGYVVKRYDTETDRMVLDAYADISLNGVNMSIEFIRINSSKFELPISSHLDINIHSGTATVSQDIVLLPGANITVDKGATVKVLEGVQMYAFDAAEWNNGYIFFQTPKDTSLRGELIFNGYGRGESYPVKPAVYSPTRKVDRTAQQISDAMVLLNGKLEVYGNLYTTASGAAIKSTGTGEIWMYTAPDTNTTTIKQAFQDPDARKVDVTVTPVQLQNSNGEYVFTSGNENSVYDAQKDDIYFYDADRGEWFNGVTVKFDPNGGEGTLEHLQMVGDVVDDDSAFVRNQAIKKAEGEVLVPPMGGFTRTGYEPFAWSTIPVVGDDDATFVPSDPEDIENWNYYEVYHFAANPIRPSKIAFYAQWQEIIHTVTFNANGGTGEMASQQIGEANAVALNENTFNRTGYSFLGWSEDEKAVVPTYSDKEVITVKTDLELCAVWSINSYTITFDTTGGTEMEPIKQDYNTDITKPVVPEKKGYTFAGWVIKDENGNEKLYDIPTKMPAEDVTVTAKWNKEQYSIGYDLAGGALAEGVSNPESYDVETETFTLNNPHREGYEFAGWTSTGLNEASTKVIIEKGSTDNRQYKATWTAISYGITYDLAGGSLVEGITNPESYNIETNEFTLKNPVREGYKFTGWTGTGLDTASTNVTIQQGSIGDRSYTANWEEVMHTVSFYANDGTGEMDSQQIGEVTEVALRANTFARMGYVFLGWSEDPNAVVPTYEDKTKLTVKADVELYAVWSVITYEIVYTNMDDAQVNGTNPEKFTVLSESFTLINPTKNGYTFVGWTGSNGTDPELVVKIEKGSTEDRSYSANWKENMFTVSFDANGGEGKMDDQKIGAVNPVALRKNAFSKTGYTFTGWRGKDVAYKDGQEIAITEDVTLFAVWEINQYTITFDTNGGSEIGAITQDYGSDVTTPAAPTKTGYDFVGWVVKDDNDNEKPYDIPTKMPAEDVTVTAKWVVKQYGITYDLAGGSLAEGISNPTSYTVETDTFTLIKPTRVGYEFAGWYGTDIDSTSYDVTVEKGSIGERTYTANWKPTTYTIKYSGLEGATVGENADSYTIESYSFTLNNPSKEGYTFAGWELDGVNVGKNVTVPTGSTGDRIYKATWTVNQYDAVFESGSGAFSDGFTSKTVPTDYGTVPVAPAAPTKPGYEFTGWTPELEAMGIDGATYTATYKAKIDTKYTVETYTMDVNGQYGDPVYVTKEGETDSIVSETPVAATGFTLDTANSVLEGKIAADGSLVLKIYFIRNQYNVIYKVDGNSYEEKTYYFGAAVTALDEPTKEGYTFSGWSEIPATMPAHDVTVTGSFTINKYTVTWTDEKGNEIHKEENVEHGSNVTAPAVPEKPGYTGSWKASSNNVTDNTTIQSTYDPNNYSIIWMVGDEPYTWTDGGEEKTTTVVVYDTAITIPAVDPEKEGHTFQGWFTGEDGTGIKVTNETTYKFGENGEGIQAMSTMAEDETVISGNTALYAHFTVNSYSVTWNVDGVETQETYNYGAAIVKPADPSKEGYTFTGWSPAVPAAMPASDQNFTATWKINQYTITFDTKGGTEIASITQDYATAVTAPADPTKEGYTFIGWEPTVPATMPVDGMTITAKWTANKYTVTWNVDGKTSTSEQTYSLCLQLPVDVPEKAGYIFAGWFTEMVGGTQVTPDTEYEIAGDTTYYAHWDAKKYQITWIVDENNTETTEQTYDAKLVLPTINKPGYTLLGWFTAAEGGDQVTADTVYQTAGGSTFYARWTETDYKIAYVLDGGTHTNEAGYDVAHLPMTLSDAAKPNFVFMGWTSADLGITEPTIGLTIPEDTIGDLSFTAHFEKAYASLVSGETTTYYLTLAEAVAAAKDDDTVNLLDSMAGTGMVIDKSITIDFGGNTYTFNCAVGSAGTETNGLQLMPGKDIALKNGTLAADPVATNAQGKVVKYLVQNYANLALKDMTLEANANSLYTLSINSGDVTLKASTITAAPGKVAFDVCKYATYAAPSVTADNCTVEGIVEVTGGELTVIDGTYTSNDTDVFVVDSGLLTINGDPTVIGGSKNQSTAVWAKNTGKVVINGGSFTVGADETAVGGYNDLIYAKENASIVINGGTFDGPAKTGTSQKFLLNLQDNSNATITVSGGTYIGFDPQNSGTEPAGKDDDFTAEGYIAVDDGNGNFTVIAHTHAYTYSAEDIVITESCHSGCRHSATAKLYVLGSVSKVYTGSPIEAYGVVTSESWQGGELTVSYENNVNAGEATAKITAGGATASATFTIANADLTDVAVAQVDTLVYNESAQTPVVTTKATAVNGQKVTFTYGTEEGTYGSLPEFETVGTYTVYFKATAPNHNETTGSFIVTVKQGTPSFDLPEDLTAAVGQTLADIELPDGWTWNAPETQVTEAGELKFEATFTHENENYKSVSVELTVKAFVPTITFNTDGGTEIAAITQAFGTDVTAPADPTKEGYSFAGWDVDVPATMPAEDMTITALWTINQYTITFADTGDKAIDPIKQDYATAVTAPADPTKEGYTFDGWDMEIPATMPAKNLTITAQWTVNQYTITFNTDGGTAIAPITQDFGTAVTAPVEPTKEGYTFTGWNVEIPATMPAEDMTITAQWKINQYTITFDTDGGNTIDAIVQNYNTAVTAPAAPKKTGYTFVGWDKEIPTTMPAENVTITAQWEVRQYTITFVTNGGSAVAPITQDYGTAIEKPEDPTRTGYTFAGWDVVVPTTMPAGNLTITAKWTINQYTITFNTDGGTEIAAITQNYNTAVTAPAAPTKEGHTFAGWDIAVPATMPAENMTITAKWNVNRYTISFNTAGGSAVSSITQDYGTAVTAPAEPTRTGYSFAGWDMEIPATMPAKNLTITAQWTINQYTITFNTDGGNEITPITQDYGTAVTAPANPTKEGHTFAGWDRAIPATMPAEDVRITARWNINQYTITFNANGGSAVAPITQNYGTAVTAPADPTRTGYTFDGWDVVIPATMPAGNITIKAKWTAIDYKVTYELNGGSVTGNPETYTVEDSFTLNNPVREGYIFDGWKNAAGELSKDVKVQTGTTGDLTFTAMWIIKTYTVAMKDDSGKVAIEGTPIATHGEDLTVVLKNTVSQNRSDVMIESVTVDGTVCDASAYSYNAESGELTVSGAQVTGNIVIEAVALLDVQIAMNDGVATTDAVSVAGDVATVVQGNTYEEVLNFAEWFVKEGHTYVGVTDGTDTYTGSYTVTADAQLSILWECDELTHVPAVEATCIAEGNIEYWMCRICGKFYADEKGAEEITDKDSVITTDRENHAWSEPAYTINSDGTHTAAYVCGRDASHTKSNTSVHDFTHDAAAHKCVCGAIETYTVTFAANGAEGEMAVQIVEHGITESLNTNAFTKIGHSFAGWQSSDGKTYTDGQTVAFTGNVVLTAQWERIAYVVTWNVDGDQSNQVEYKYGETIVAPADPQKTGYEFTGWTGFTEGMTMPAQSQTFHAQWTAIVYDIKVDTDGDGILEKTVRAPYDGTLVLEDGVKAADNTNTYTFLGWSTTPDGEVLEYLPTVTGSASYYAVFEANPIAYTITLHAQGGSELDALTGGYEATVILPEATGKTGYTFVGWAETADPDADTLAAGSEFTITGNDDLYAVWQINTYELTWIVDGEETMVPYEYGAAVAPVADPEKEGHSFTGWDKEIPGTMPAEDVTITAVFAINTYTIGWDTNEDGVADVTDTVNWNVVPVYDAEKHGAITKESTVDTVYTFSGWTVEPVAATDDVIYTAKFDSEVRKYTITWMVEGEETTTSVAYGDMPVAPTAAKAEDNYNTYAFSSWNTAADGTGIGIETVTGEATYYALFTATAKVYTLTLDLAGGHIGQQNAVIYSGGYGEAITAPETDPEKTGYTFTGWSEDIPAELTETKTITALWQINQYTITFDTVGAGEIDAITQDYGTAIEAPADPVKEGYTFEGWSPAVPGTMPAEDMNIVAVWQINQYSITFDTAGGSEISPITADYGTAVTAPADPTRAGYTFQGWDVSIPETIPAEDVVVTAIWTANENKIELYTEKGGSVYASIVAKTDESIASQLPADPTKEGYTFGGWVDAEGNAVALPDTMTAYSMVLYAKWNISEFTITFNLGGGMIGDETTYTIVQDFETEITAPSDPTRAGYTFQGWVTRDAQGNETAYQIPEIMPAVNVTVFAKWAANRYTVTFMDDAGNVLFSQSLYCDEVIKVPTITRKGYTFGGWNETIPGVMPPHDLVLTSTWIANSYTITFITDGGSEIEPITADYGTALTEPEAPTKEGYTFLGWNEPFPETMPAGNLTLTAQWTTSEYTVTWLNHDGSELAKQIVKHGQLPVYEGAEPVRTETAEASYSFIGWTPEIVEATANASYTAQYEETMKAYTVTFVFGNGQENQVITVVNGDAIETPEVAEREGYVFNGWKPALPETMPAENITVTAQWVKSAYSITFDADNGTEPVVVTAGWGEMYSKPATPVKEGYTFNGWTNEAGEIVKLPVVMPKEDLNLKASWTVNSYTITFVSDGGTAVESMTLAYGAAVAAPEAPTREHYAFQGWAPALPETMPATDLTVTAQWKWIYTGWYTDENGTTYMVEGEKAYYGQWKEIEGNTYYFDDQSYIVYDLYTTTAPDGSHVGIFVFDNDGKFLSDKTGLHDSNAGDTYWVENGEVILDKGLTRVVLEDGEVNYYFFGEDGKAAKDTILWVEKTNGYLVKWDYTFDENGVIIHHEDTSRQGVHEDEEGVECYYIDGVKVHWGLFMIGEHYYYACADGSLVKNKSYWITIVNGLLEEGSYKFDEYGRIVFEELKNGIFAEDGSLFYYEDGKRTYKGLFEGDGILGSMGHYYYVNTQGEVINSRKYWITKTNGLLAEGSYEFDETGRIILEGKQNGFLEEADGIYYYVDGVKTYAGLIYEDGYYYYVNSSCKLITGRTYWIVKTNGLMPEGSYEFDELGRMIIEEEPDSVVKNGIVEENGVKYYYVDGVKTFAGLIVIDGDYYYVNSACKVITGRSYWITKTNGLMPEGSYTFDADGKMVL